MRKNRPGYPLPSGDLGGDEIVCQLVYLPDRPEYWQALFSSVHYLTSWLAWAPDDDLRGKDAAANWREAFELTVECWRMTCLDEITERLDIMIDLLGNQTGCCGNLTIGPIITVVTNIVPWEGDDPTEWGETEVADWDEWGEYICYHAHVYVDSLISGAGAIDLAVELGSYTIDFFAGIMAFMQYLGLEQVLGLNQVLMVYDDFRNETDLSGWFTPLAEKFETAREDIVCAIVRGSSLSNAVEDAIDNNALWELFYNLTDYAAVQALIYEGTIDGSGYLAPIRRDDCVCPEDYGEDEYGIWLNGFVAGWRAIDLLAIDWDVFECQPGGAGYNLFYRIECDRNAFPAIYGVSDTDLRFIRIEFDYMFSTGGSPTVPDDSLKVLVYESFGVHAVVFDQLSTGAEGAWDEWHHAVLDDDDLPDYVMTVSSHEPLVFVFNRAGSRLNRFIRLKNVEIWVSHT